MVRAAKKVGASIVAPNAGENLSRPQQNIEIEIALLGAILVNNRAYEKVSEFLLPEHFADGVHGRIFEACGKLIERGQQATPATLRLQHHRCRGLRPHAIRPAPAPQPDRTGRGRAPSVEL